VGYFIHNLFVFDNITSYIFFFAILAFVHNSIEFEENEKEIFLDKIKEKNKTQVIVPVIIVLTIFSLYSFNVKGVLANRSLLLGLSPHPEGLSENLKYFKKALSYNYYANQEIREQLMLFSVRALSLTEDQDLKSNFFELAKKEVQKEMEKDPKNARMRMFAGSFFNNFRVYDEGLFQLEKAKKLTPNKQSVYFDIGLSYINQGKYDDALDSFKKAYELEPKYDKARELYALSAIYAGDDSLFEELLQGKLVANRNFLNAYKNTKQLDKMVLVAEKMLEKRPNDPQSFITLAATYYEVGRNSDAIIQLEKAIELDPNFKTQGEEFIKAIQDGARP